MLSDLVANRLDLAFDFTIGNDRINSSLLLFMRSMQVRTSDNSVDDFHDNIIQLDVFALELVRLQRALLAVNDITG